MATRSNDEIADLLRMHTGMPSSEDCDDLAYAKNRVRAMRGVPRDSGLFNLPGWRVREALASAEAKTVIPVPVVNVELPEGDGRAARVRFVNWESPGATLNVAVSISGNARDHAMADSIRAFLDCVDQDGEMRGPVYKYRQAIAKMRDSLVSTRRGDDIPVDRAETAKAVTATGQKLVRDLADMIERPPVDWRYAVEGLTTDQKDALQAAVLRGAFAARFDELKVILAANKGTSVSDAVEAQMGHLEAAAQAVMAAKRTR